LGVLYILEIFLFFLVLMCIIVVSPGRFLVAVQLLLLLFFGIVLEVAAFEISVLPKFDLLVGRLLKLGLCFAVGFPYFLCP
jgi:hypothetical protein